MIQVSGGAGPVGAALGALVHQDQPVAAIMGDGVQMVGEHVMIQAGSTVQGNQREGSGVTALGHKQSGVSHVNYPAIAQIGRTPSLWRAASASQLSPTGQGPPVDPRSARHHQGLLVPF
jgi:hypothetical protein